MDEVHLLTWFGQAVHQEDLTLEDCKDGRLVCEFLVDVLGESEYRDSILPGMTNIEKNKNIRLAKQLYALLNFPFPLSSTKLIAGDDDEFLKLLADLQSKFQASQNSYDDFLDRLENNLTEKLNATVQFRKEMEEIAIERSFYFDKLREAEQIVETEKPRIKKLLKTDPRVLDKNHPENTKITHEYQTAIDLLESCSRILTLRPNDFGP